MSLRWKLRPLRCRAWMVAAVLACAGCGDWPGAGQSPSDAGVSGSTRPTDTSGLLGSSCGNLVRCLSPWQCLENAPGGLCTQLCMSDEDCPGGGCVYFDAIGALLCLKQCSSDQMCRHQYDCLSDGVQSLCTPTSQPLDQ